MSEAHDETALILVLGGARSGKSAFAEGIVERRPAPWTYIATAQAFDDEMRERIARHRERRGPTWLLIEAPHELPAAIRAAPAGAPLLIDCLTLYLTNRMLAQADLASETDDLLAALKSRTGVTVAVSSEVGLSIVPENALAREFRDAAGDLHRKIAEIATSAYLIVAGLPLQLK